METASERHMRLRQAVTRNPHQHGPVERLVAFLSLRGFTAYDGLMCPFLVIFASIMLVTPAAQMHESPVYSPLMGIAPIGAWAALLIALAVVVVIGIASQRWLMARLAYMLVSSWWFAIAWLAYAAATTLLSPAVYVLIGVACLYRQAEVAVVAEYGHE